MSGREASDQVALAASHKHILLTFCGSVLPEEGVGEIINPGQLYLNVTVTLAGSCENCDFLSQQKRFCKSCLLHLSKVWISEIQERMGV